MRGRVLALILALPLSIALMGTYASTAQADPRPQAVLRGLDYLHARQEANGGFNSMPATCWALLAIAASGERPESTPWKVSGKSPFTYLDTRSHEAAATGYDVESAPVYYARAIMAYVAAQHADRVYIAGQPRVDLLAKLYLYQDVDNGSTQGSFSPSTSNRDFQAVRTTSWAILAMHAVKEDGKDRFNDAIAWLADQQRADGGFPSESTADTNSNTLDTALAIQAFQLAEPGAVDPATIADARLFLKAQQKADGSFGNTATSATDAQATAAAIQAIIALGEQPDDAFWTAGSSTPLSALKTLQLKSGAFTKQRGSSAQLLPTTSWSLIALRKKPFTTFPRTIGSTVTPFVFRPRITSASPKHNAKYTQTHVVLIEATYSDGTNGTGVNPAACRVYVDGVNKSKPADIGRLGLRLRLTVANGSHSYKLRVVDYAGNVKELQRTFAVAVPVIPSVTPTSAWPPYTPVTPQPSTPRPVTTLTPTPSSTTTASPGVWPSSSPSGAVSGIAVPSPSPSGSPVAGATGGDSTGYLAGTLLAMLPIGATAAYLLHRRRAALLNAAHEGKTLASHGTGWHQVSDTLGGAKRSGGTA